MWRACLFLECGLVAVDHNVLGRKEIIARNIMECRAELVFLHTSALPRGHHVQGKRRYSDPLGEPVSPVPAHSPALVVFPAFALQSPYLLRLRLSDTSLENQRRRSRCVVRVDRYGMLPASRSLCGGYTYEGLRQDRSEL